MNSNSLNKVLEDILGDYRTTSRLDGANEQFRAALAQFLTESGFADGQQRLLEVNTIGSLAAWIELVIEERELGHNRIPDFARNLQHIFIMHCRKHEVEAQAAFDMAIELSGAILDTALAYQRHLGLGAKELPCGQE